MGTKYLCKECGKEMERTPLGKVGFKKLISLYCTHCRRRETFVKKRKFVSIKI